MALRDLLKTEFKGELKAGKHSTTLISWALKANESNPDNDYIVVELATENGPYKRNLFEKDLTFFLAHVRRQLGRSHENVQPVAFLNHLRDTRTPFDMWVSYPTVPTARGMERRQNINFMEPRKQVSAESNHDDMEIPTT